MSTMTKWWIVAVSAIALGAAWWLASGEWTEGRIVEGPALVPQAGTLVVRDVWIPLLGLRPPREDPNCVLQGRIVQCPLISAAKLAELVRGKTIRCQLKRFPEDDRNWGVCGVVDPLTGKFVGEPDSINRNLVNLGWAIADPHYLDAYVAIGEEARKARRGMWRTFFLAERTSTGILRFVNKSNDAGTVEVQDTHVRLWGIDAPELPQQCIKESIPYPCGLLAASHLHTIVTDTRIVCQVDKFPDGRHWGECGLPSPSGRTLRDDVPTVSEVMVRAGWALANRNQTDVYVKAEAEARREKRGLWAGEFVPPADWRSGVRR